MAKIPFTHLVLLVVLALLPACPSSQESAAIKELPPAVAGSAHAPADEPPINRTTDGRGFVAEIPRDWKPEAVADRPEIQYLGLTD